MKWKIILLLGLVIVMSVNVKAPVFDNPIELPDYTFKSENEEINVSYYTIVDGEKIKPKVKAEMKEDRKFGFEFDETEVKDDVKTKKNKDWDKKVYFEIEGAEDYSVSGQYEISKLMTFIRKNTIGQPTEYQGSRTLSFEDIFRKDINLYNYTLKEVNVTICDEYEVIEVNFTLDNGSIITINQTTENCIKSHLELVNATERNDRNFSFSMTKNNGIFTIEFYNLFDLDPTFTDNLDNDFNKGTLWRTNISNSANGLSNVTLNYTVLTKGPCAECGNMSAGQLNYTMTGNFTSQVFDTGDTTSQFDKLMWTSNLFNYSDVLAFVTDGDGFESDFGVFYKNLTVGDDSGGNIVNALGLNFTDATSVYTLPSGIDSSDIVGAGWDDGGAADMFLFLRNGSTLVDNSQLSLPNPSFTNGFGKFMLPRGFNTSQIIGIVMGFSKTAAFLNNGTYLVVSTQASPFSFNNSYYYFVDNSFGFNYSDIIGVVADISSKDIGIIFKNGSITTENNILDFNKDINFTDVTTKAIFNSNNAITGNNITKSTNITLQTRVGNSSPITTPWSDVYISDNGGVGNQDISTLVGRYIQYKAVFTTPDKYITPQLENVSINYTIPPDFTSLVNTTDRISFTYTAGVFNQTYFNITINAIQLNVSKVNGTYLSQVFDAGTTQQWLNISWTPGGYYGSELGRDPPLKDSTTPPRDFLNASINTSGLVGLWHFNNETGYGENATGGSADIVRDFSPDVNSERAGSTRNNGTTKGGMTINKTGYKLGGGAGTFDGSNDYVSLVSPQVGGNAAFTISAWFKTSLNQLTAGNNIYSEYGPGGAYLYLNLNNGVAGKLDFITFDGTNSHAINNVAFGYSDGAWHHVVGVQRSLSFAELYVDGVLKGTDSTTLNAFSSDGSAIGSWPTGALYNWNGLIDEVSIWNRTLSSQEIMTLYKRGALRLNLSVRSCDDSACSGEDWVFNATNSSKSTIVGVANNRFVQYQANYFTNDSSLSPELYNVTIHMTPATLADITPPVISSLTNTTTTNQSVYITWTTDENANESNNTMGAYPTFVGIHSSQNLTSGTSHSLFIANLSNGTRYNFNTTAYDVSANFASANFSFTTALNPPSATTCDCPASGNWVINDGSVCELDTGETCDIGGNCLHVNNGGFRNNGGTFRAGCCFVAENQIWHGGAGTYCGG